MGNSAIDMKQLMGPLTSFLIGGKHKPKAQCCRRQLTAKCRLSPDLFLTDSHWGQKISSPVSGLPSLSEAAGPAWKICLWGLCSLHARIFASQLGVVGKSLIYFMKTHADICIVLVSGESPCRLLFGVFFKEAFWLISVCVCRARHQKISATSHLNREGKSSNRKSMN